jgi:hypothetical protein
MNSIVNFIKMFSNFIYLLYYIFYNNLIFKLVILNFLPNLSIIYILHLPVINPRILYL